LQLSEPEEDLQSSFEYIFFLITSPDKYSLEEKFVCQAMLLQHPYHINGDIAFSLYHQSLCQSKGEELPDNVISDLPSLDTSILLQIQEDTVTLQRRVLSKLLGKFPEAFRFVCAMADICHCLASTQICFF